MNDKTYFKALFEGKKEKEALETLELKVSKSKTRLEKKIACDAFDEAFPGELPKQYEKYLKLPVTTSVSSVKSKPTTVTVGEDISVKIAAFDNRLTAIEKVISDIAKKLDAKGEVELLPEKPKEKKSVTEVSK